MDIVWIWSLDWTRFHEKATKLVLVSRQGNRHVDLSCRTRQWAFFSMWYFLILPYNVVGLSPSALAAPFGP